MPYPHPPREDPRGITLRPHLLQIGSQLADELRELTDGCERILGRPSPRARQEPPRSRYAT